MASGHSSVDITHIITIFLRLNKFMCCDNLSYFKKIHLFLKLQGISKIYFNIGKSLYKTRNTRLRKPQRRKN